MTRLLVAAAIAASFLPAEGWARSRDRSRERSALVAPASQSASLISQTIITGDFVPNLGTATTGSVYEDVTIPTVTNGLLVVKLSANNANSDGFEGSATAYFNEVEMTRQVAAGDTMTDPYYNYSAIFTTTTVPAAGTYKVGVLYPKAILDTGATGNTINCVIVVEVWQYVDQTTPVTATGTDADTTGTASITISSAATEMVTDSLSSRLGTTPTVGAGQVQTVLQTKGASGEGNRGQASYEVGAASVTMSWTGGTAEFAQTAISIKSAP